MTPLLLLAALVPDSNLTLVLALLVIAAQGAQSYWNKRGAKVARETQTAILQGATDEQTVLIIGSLNAIRQDVNGIRLAQDAMRGAAEIARADHSARLVELKRRADGTDRRFEVVESRLETIEKGRKE